MGERRPGRGPSEAHHRQSLPPQNAVVAAPAVEQAAKGGGSLIEFSSIAREDPNEGLVFGETPEHCTCPHCERSVVTFIDHEASWVTWLLGFMVWFSLGWMMAFVILPLLWPAFKDVVHHCPRCLNVIARKSRISFPTFRTEVMTFKIGGCAVVLARKYVAILVGLVLTIIVVYLLRSTVHLNQVAEVQKGPPSMLTWDDFLSDCGPRTSLRHRTSTVRAFEERFRRRTFTWQGEVRMIREGFEVLFLRTKSVVLVKMYPPRYPRRDLPDVALLFGEERNMEVATLNPGDWVEFEATMTAHGYRGDPEVMTLWHIREATRPEPLSSSWPIAGNAGRAAAHGKEEDSHGNTVNVSVGTLSKDKNASDPPGSNKTASSIPADPLEPTVGAQVNANASVASAEAGKAAAGIAGTDVAPA
mmetsp:Transcript_61350/g.142785  ORF Transcript_61350/g.142785 Transcript_61350/m.142785 type:complete len:416 (-) Transcript_61350:64-1311(-)|eukprot:CAMPEP_0171106502 /NCGR_PEP_ID=MMETSP0766_2-20121228/64884_1 /TAXON_ID=439317 /ORGANISM="Gambierdiscus australes, Strain CAWD 149" /LENGTH=415 /DNA_ID=CAMNT_0011567597 /DNA_START=58 /DNA_END=1305 /DNA_ORIENTATION=-